MTNPSPIVQSIGRALTRSVSGASAALVLLACSGGSPPSGDVPAVGGSDGFGGTLTTSSGASTRASAGGTTSAHGSARTSTASSTAGGNTNMATAETGGSRATGGAPATGGNSATATTGSSAPSTGGALTVGGSQSSGGTRATGGAATGGTSAGKASGGVSSGGSATGGTKTTGGVPVSGGKQATGGTSSASGGGLATGGTTSTGTGPITIWMAGDSTMMNCSSACPCGWGSQFASYFGANVTVQNRAVGGRSIQTWLYEKAVTDTMGADKECVLGSDTHDSRWTTMLASMKAGDYLMISFGINDGDPTCPRHVGTTRFATLLDMMVKAVQARGGVPVLLTPTNSIDCNGSRVSPNRGFLAETKAVGTSDNVPVIDLNQLSMNLYESLGFCPNSGDYTSTTSNLGKFFCEDHTHFEAAGANQIAGLVANALTTNAIGLATYLR